MPEEIPGSARIAIPIDAAAQHSKDHRLDKLMLGAAGVIVTVSIAIASWVFGGLHERVDKAEDNIHGLELKLVEQKNTIERLKEANGKQWELISGNSRDISELKGAVERHHDHQ